MRLGVRARGFVSTAYAARILLVLQEALGQNHGAMDLASLMTFADTKSKTTKNYSISLFRFREKYNYYESTKY